MDNLKTLYYKRDEQFSAQTLKIFEKIDSTLACLSLYLSDVDDSVAQGVIAWEDTSIIDDLVVVIGTVQYELGDIVTIDLNDIEITPNNIEEVQRIIHMSVPYALVIADDQDDIMEYLYTEGVDLESMGNPPTNEFDLSELSDEQLKSLRSAPDTNRDN